MVFENPACVKEMTNMRYAIKGLYYRHIFGWLTLIHGKLKNTTPNFYYLCLRKSNIFL